MLSGKAARLAVVVSCALLGAACDAQAHEFWIRPERFTTAAGETLGIGLAVGTGWPGESFARQPVRIVRFALVGAGGEHGVEGAGGDEPAGRVAALAAGTTWAVYRSTFAEARLEAEPFEAYLREEGLEAIVERRRQAGASARPGRERYSRCAKALITVGNETSALATALSFDTPVGLALEIVPLTDPRRVAADGRLDVRVLHLGRPLPGTLVKAMREAGPAQWFSARTDGDGRATLALPAASGVWLVNTVHMQPAPARSGNDWESTWSSLTFETRIPSTPSAPSTPSTLSTGSQSRP